MYKKINMLFAEMNHIVKNGDKKEEIIMTQTIRELTEKLLAVPYACKDLKEAAQKYLDAEGKPEEASMAKAYIERIQADIMPLDELLAFVKSEAGAKVFGEEGAQKMLAHAEERKAAGEKFCDCEACAACEALLGRKEEILG